MRSVGSSYPLIVMYTAGAGQEAVETLRSEGCLMQFTKKFNPNGEWQGLLRKDKAMVGEAKAGPKALGCAGPRSV